MKVGRIGALAAGVATAATTAVGFGVAAQAEPTGADVEVYTYCGGALPGYPPPLQVIVRNIGTATAENVAVNYWAPFGPSGSVIKPTLAPGEIANYTVGTARTLELITATVTSTTPDANSRNNFVVQPMFCPGSI
ncbi:hypothetical protein IRT45_22200 [Nocardia sp. BSTN01]|uniref:hypothetical protein n=1 Tax=Nocardia sp. BSTN01 TaxID=2783665 RepID=UPI001890B267|nr:hypothetical protein [Nocardia sp. BSTN01]MBF4999858.1 hypothetical protein [Nocardia sp. BSTN01]